MSGRAGLLPPLFLIAVALGAGWLLPLWLPAHPTNPPEGAPIVTFLGRDTRGAVTFAIACAAALAGWWWALWICRQRPALGTSGSLPEPQPGTDPPASLATTGGDDHRPGRFLFPTVCVGLAVPVLLVSLLLPTFPGGTQDLFHNVADARLLWLHGENPNLVPPGAHPEDAFTTHVFGYTDLTSAYGPLWYTVAGLPLPFAGDGLAPNVVGQKLLVSVFFLATLVLVVCCAHDKTLAAILIGWCPLLLWEFAVNGHNDAVMVLFAAAAVVAAERGRTVAVFPLLALSVVTKFTTLLLGPPLLIWLWRNEPHRKWLWWSLVLGAMLTVLWYLPFWAGSDTLAFLRRPGMTFILSPSTLLNAALAQITGDAAAKRAAYALTGGLFALWYLWTLAALARQRLNLVDGCFDVFFAYLMLASWWFWPWYLSWLAPFAAWSGDRRRQAAFVLACSAGLLSYLYWWYDPPESSPSWFAWYAALVAFMFLLPVTARLWPRRVGTKA